MAHAAVAAHFVLEVAAHAPPHLERRDLGNLRHRFDIAVARRTRRVRIDAQSSPQSFDMTHVRELGEAGQGVNPNPFGGFPLAPGVAHFLDLGLMRRRRAADQLVSPDARLERWNPRLARDRGRVVAVHARDLILIRVDVVPEEDRLARAFERPRIAHFGRLVPRRCRGCRLGLLAAKDRKRECEHQHHDRS